MYENLTKVARKTHRTHIICGICAIFIFCLFIYTFKLPAQLNALKGEAEYFEITDNAVKDDFNKDYVEYNAPFLFDYFAYYTWSQSIKSFSAPSRFYPAIIWTSDSGTPKLIAIEVPESKFKIAEEIANNTYNFTGENISDLQNLDFYNAKGSVKLLSVDERKFFEESYADSGMEILPYAITDGQIGNFNIGYVIFAIFILGVGMLLIVSGAINYKKSSNREILKTNFEEIYGLGTFEEALLDCEYGDRINNIYVGAKYIAFADDFPAVVEISDLIWIYKKQTYHNGIRTNTRAVFNTKKGKSYFILIKNREFDDVCSVINKKNPFIAYGYSQSLENLYKNDIEGFINMVENENANNNTM